MRLQSASSGRVLAFSRLHDYHTHPRTLIDRQLLATMIIAHKKVNLSPPAALSNKKDWVHCSVASRLITQLFVASLKRNKVYNGHKTTNWLERLQLLFINGLRLHFTGLLQENYNYAMILSSTFMPAHQSNSNVAKCWWCFAILIYILITTIYEPSYSWTQRRWCWRWIR